MNSLRRFLESLFSKHNGELNIHKGEMDIANIWDCLDGGNQQMPKIAFLNKLYLWGIMYKTSFQLHLNRAISDNALDCDESKDNLQIGFV